MTVTFLGKDPYVMSHLIFEKVLIVLYADVPLVPVMCHIQLRAFAKAFAFLLNCSEPENDKVK